MIIQTEILNELEQLHATVHFALHELRELRRRGEGNIPIRAAMKKLERAFLAHFSMEEELMAQTKYPGWLPHKSEHMQFIIDYFVLLKLDFKQYGVLDVASMENWFSDHLSLQDQPFEAYLEEHLD